VVTVQVVLLCEKERKKKKRGEVIGMGRRNKCEVLVGKDEKELFYIYIW